MFMQLPVSWASNLKWLLSFTKNFSSFWVVFPYSYQFSWCSNGERFFASLCLVAICASLLIALRFFTIHLYHLYQFPLSLSFTKSQLLPFVCVFIIIILNLFFVVENITDVLSPHTPIEPLLPTPAPPQAFTILLLVFMDYAYVYIEGEYKTTGSQQSESVLVTVF